MSKTPEELAEEWTAITFDESDLPDHEKSKPSDLATYKAMASLGYLAGYKAAQEHAHAALEEAEAEIDRLQSKLSHAGILTTEHLLGADNSPIKPDGWISVKDRLPEDKATVIYWHDTFGPSVGHYDSTFYKPNYHWWSYNFGDHADFRVSWWMPLPPSPKEKV